MKEDMDGWNEYAEREAYPRTFAEVTRAAKRMCESNNGDCGKCACAVIWCPADYVMPDQMDIENAKDFERAVKAWYRDNPEDIPI